MRVPFGNLLRRKAPSEPPQPSHSKRQHPRFHFGGSAKLSWLTAEGQPRCVRASLIDASEGGMAVCLGEPLAAGAYVWILLPDGTDGRGEVRYCNALESGHRVGLRFIAEEREEGRGNSRTVLDWIDPSGRLRSCAVTVRNAQEGEIEVLSPQPLPGPAIVMLSGNHVRCLGCIRDCRPNGAAFCLRVQVVSEALPNADAA